MPGGVASSLGMARYIGSMPGLKSKVALGMNALSRGKAIPTGVEVLVYNHLAKAGAGGYHNER